jgi:hypothetical protein
MEVCGYFNAPAALHPGKEHPVLIGCDSAGPEIWPGNCGGENNLLKL